MTSLTPSLGPTIPPVPPGTARPRWSVMIPTYDCAGLLAETLSAVLAQDPGPAVMQIEVVDDASNDNPHEVVIAVGKGRVDFHRQPRNLGVSRNLTDCIRRARGEIVHILHGDDAVLPGFYAAMDRAFTARPDLGAAFCRQIFMDTTGCRRGLSPLELRESGVLPDAVAHLAAEQRIMTPSICVRRAAYERLGGFLEQLVCAEDWEMWVRIAAAYPIWYETEALALYRMRDDSNTGRHVRTGEDIVYTAEVIDINTRRLPPERAAVIAAQARRTYAHSALDIAESAFLRGDTATARAQLAGALTLSRSPSVLADAWITIARALAGRALGRGRGRPT